MRSSTTSCRHVHWEHVDEALRNARSGPVPEGCVGGGTGMICYQFKGGIGTSSRHLPPPLEKYRVGVLVQANHGARELLRIDGVPVGEEISDLLPESGSSSDANSILMIVATDAPLLPHQLKRVTRRAGLGLARNGSVAHNGSGDIFIAFSTADRSLGRNDRLLKHSSVPNDALDPLFAATAQATEEAIVNALIAARDMTGDRGHYAKALPHDELMAKLRALTNLQVVEDEASSTGYGLEVGPFPGWKEVPTW